MSQRQARKIRQLFFREAREKAREIGEDFYTGKVFKVKPRYFPKWLWRWMARQLVQDAVYRRTYGFTVGDAGMKKSGNYQLETE